MTEHSSILALGIGEVLTQFQKRDLSVKELVQAYLSQMERTASLNIYITVTEERALKDAEISDAHWKAGTQRPLEGIPLGIKDAFCTKDVRTTAASKILGDFIPPYESTVTQNLWDAGAVLLGKTNMDEFCMGSTTTPEHTGPVLNPWDATRTVGGSSGGSAAAVAAGAALATMGTDTGGSVRQPASFCGVVGLRPTYGRCSRRGMIAFSSSLDQAGPLTRSVRDAALLLEVMSGHDLWDATSSRQAVPSFSKALGESVRGMKVGIPKELYDKQGTASSVWEKGRALFSEAGCEIVFVSLPYLSYALPCYYILTSAEAASNLQRYDGVKYGFRASPPFGKEWSSLDEMYEKTRGEGFGREVKRRILTGTYALTQGHHDVYYEKAISVKRLISEDFSRVFQQVDVLMTPTTPTDAFPLAEIPEDPVTMYNNDIFTVPVNVGGVSAISVPVETSLQGMPMGLQIIAPPFEEMSLIRFGGIIESCAALPPYPFL
jgi:aspartyl-tRNA(Asn)/glutamyl-tRNA(Gln) amidotransferase subunit A